MFDDIQEPKDMFADVPESAVPSAASPSAPSSPEGGQASAQPVMRVAQKASTTISPNQAAQYADVPKSGRAGLRLFITLLVSFVCIGSAGYAAYRFMVRDAVPQQVSDVIEKTTTPPEEVVPIEETVAPQQEQDEDGAGPTAVIDSDGDGLTNDEERAAGTSVAKPDTDGDGLGDREEVKVYDTDPKNVDTDGDGYSDGDEVKNGYNPNGEGRLFEIPE